MDLKLVSEDIMAQINHNKECGKDDVWSVEEIESIIKRKVVDVIEPEGVYEKGKYYDGLGKYIGIVDTFPYGADFFLRNHHFSKEAEYKVSVGKVAIINKVLIREIKR